MSEEQFVADGAPTAQVGETAATGHGSVDGVIASLGQLAELPVDEHVAVFERAHEQLRGALDAPSGPRPPAGTASVG
ncbi:hypothetical protein [Nocardioides jiangxiensis]|uniref:Uncharacterized protein n=1 Tax=Nocardioides jiangxiensis TaxID=3064524 RepID=A0ABT9AXJ7_9ACTN|nr:hypothetical protein [Nocardioides sp. WY-20]MDO7866745.1 hypothetical protein [Nocardioides sp. WY-20]